MVKGKKNPTDFALWKFTPNGVKRQMEWDSPWAPPGSQVHPEGSPRGGKAMGFPGWHIECSAMSQKYLGDQFDIHCGGIDHLNVHHTNEVAQSQAAFGKIPARFWLHGEYLLFAEEKIAKSEGNLLTVQTLIDKGFNPLAYRYLVLTAHWRSKMNFTWESMEAAQSALNNLYSVVVQYPDGGQILEEYQKQFQEAINDDLNMPEALALVWKLTKDDEVSDEDKKQTLFDFDKVLGLGLKKIKKIEIPEEIKKLASEREKLRQEKKWQEADEIRKKIEEKGWLIKDTEQGPKIIKK